LKKIYELVEDPTKFYNNYINNDKEFNKVIKSIENELNDLTIKVKDLINKNKNLFDELSNFTDKSSKNIIREKINKNNENIEILENRKKEVEDKLLSLNKERYSLRAIEDFIKSYKIKLKNLSHKQENELIEMFVNKVVVNFDEVIIELNIK
jgi:septal ring factor EnvC (AmiA/AmiB activator)